MRIAVQDIERKPLLIAGSNLVQHGGHRMKQIRGEIVHQSLCDSIHAAIWQTGNCNSSITE